MFVLCVSVMFVKFLRHVSYPMPNGLYGLMKWRAMYVCMYTSLAQVPSSAHCSQTSSAYVLPTQALTKIQAKTKYLEFCYDP
jgi:hypothetical protein